MYGGGGEKGEFGGGGGSEGEARDRVGEEGGMGKRGGDERAASRAASAAVSNVDPPIGGDPKGELGGGGGTGGDMTGEEGVSTPI